MTFTIHQFFKLIKKSYVSPDHLFAIIHEMAIDALQKVEIIEEMENFLLEKRPPVEIRDQLDMGYKIDGQSILLFEIRPQFNNPKIIHEYPFAKTTFVKSKNHWKVFWMRADLKWHSYPPCPVVKKLGEFTQLVIEDKHHCFFG